MNTVNKIDELFGRKKENILSIFFTAGFPQLNDTASVLKQLQQSGVDMVEVGFPFSDPLADGPVIQHSGQTALNNGMSLSLLFEQLNSVKNDISIPLVLMGYINPVLRMGVDTFLDKCAECGISGVILPDVPLDMWEESWAKKFSERNIFPILLITPQTADERVRKIDTVSRGFIYMVASSGTTGRKHDNTESAQEYFKRIKNLKIQNPLIAGFGIHDKASFNQACEYANGAIIGSAFVKHLEENGTNKIADFIQKLK